MKSSINKDVRPGDLLIYCKKEIPKFDFSQPVSYNLHILFVKMIIFCEGSMYTHAAIACGDDGNSAVEATPPKLRLRTPLSVDGTGYQVRRVNSESDGSLVLKYLPSDVTENEDNNDSYAMPMAMMAGLLSVLRLRVLDNHKLLSKLLPLLKLLLYPLGNYLDSLVEKKDGTSKSFFCSEFVAEAFNTTAYKEKDPNFEVKSKSNSKLGNTILDYLLGNLSELKTLKSSSSKMNITSEDNDTFLLKAGVHFFDEESNLKEDDSDNFDKLQTTSIADVAPEILDFLRKVLYLKDYKIDDDNLADSLIKFQAAFTTPTDLLDCFNLVGNYE